MKYLKTLTLIPFFISPLCLAEQAYQAPKLKVKDFKASEVSEQSPDWRSHHYRVQDQPMADRALASDPDWVDPDAKEVARDPSSVGENKANPNGLRPWRFYPAE